MFKLTTQQFAGIIDSLRAAGQSGGSEHRQATRMEVQTKIKLATLSNGKIVHCFSGLTKDVSNSGVGLFQYTPLEINSQFLICFPDGKHELVVKCVARFCRILAEGMFGIGAEYLSFADQSLVEMFNSLGDNTEDRIRNSILK